MRRHHLIEEAKAELDIAYEEVKRAESGIMALEFEYNQKIGEFKVANGEACGDLITSMMTEKERLQEDMQIESLYGIQTAAVQRFAIMCSAFTIVASVDDDGISVDLLRNVLFFQPEARAHKIEIDGALRNFARGLRAYTWEDSNAENDVKVRKSWAKIEEILNTFGQQT